MLKILKWLSIGVLLSATSLVLTLIASAAHTERERRLAYFHAEQARLESVAALQRLDPQARRLAIYDAFCHAIGDHYFDPKYSGVDWTAVARDWRPKAAAARDDKALYDEVLAPITHMFRVSHLQLLHSQAAVARADDTREQPLHVEDTGIVLAMLQRGANRVAAVSSVTRGSPAERAGVSPGWLLWKFQNSDRPGIVSVQFLRLEGPAEISSIQKSLNLNSPEVRSEAEAKTFFESRVLTLDLATPGRAPAPEFGLRTLAGDVLYVNLVSIIDANTMDRFYAALEAPHAALVLDLRHNQGGSLVETRRFAERMLPPGTLFGQVQEKTQRREERTSPQARGYDKPVVVLIGPNTYSAGEISAAAMSSLPQAQLIGSMTGGAVILSQTFALPDGGEIQVPVQEFWLPDDTQIEGIGVEPDITVYATLEDIRAGRDPVLERGLAELATQRTAAVDVVRR